MACRHVLLFNIAIFHFELQLKRALSKTSNQKHVNYSWPASNNYRFIQCYIAHTIRYNGIHINHATISLPLLTVLILIDMSLK